MKIKLVDYNRPNKYNIGRDVTIGGIYEVIDDSYEYNGCIYYEIIDDAGDSHQVLQNDCVIVHGDYKEEVEMNIGDRVKFINEDCKWFGQEYIVVEKQTYTVNVVDGGGDIYTFSKNNLRVIDEEACSVGSSSDTKDNTKTPTVNNIICFTKNHKDLEISFESGKVAVRDWVGAGDPVEYVVEDAEELKELMDTMENLNKFKTKE